MKLKIIIKYLKKNKIRTEFIKKENKRNKNYHFNFENVKPFKYSI